MLLSELNIKDAKHITRNNWDTVSDVMEWLEKNNYELIDGGIYSNIYSKPNSNMVIKVSTFGDKCWYSYAILAKNYYNKIRHLPKIGSINVVSSDDFDEENIYFVVIMKKLKKPNNNGKVQRFVKYLNDYIDYYMEDESNIDNDEYNNEVTKEFPDLPELAYILLEDQVISPDCAPDINEKNVMMDDNGELILIDASEIS